MTSPKWSRLLRHTGIVVFLLMVVSMLLYAFLRTIPLRIDLSRQQTLSLTEQSTQLLAGLSTEVAVTAFLRAGEGDAGLVLGLLREYQRHTSRFKLTVVDPDRDPEHAAVMGVDAYGTLVFESKYGRRDVYLYQLFSQDEQRQTPVFIGEQVLTGVLKALVSFEAPRVDVALFGVERQIQESGFLSFFQALAHDFRQLRLVSLDGSVRDPADVMLVVVPSFPLAPEIIARLRSHVESGRDLIVLMDPLRPSDVFADWLSDYGIRVLNGVIMDPSASYFNSVSTVIPNMASHGITQPMRVHQLSMVLPVAGALDISGIKQPVTVSPLLWSSQKSWRSQGPDASIAPGQVTGTFVLGALFENIGKGGRLLLIRDADFLRDEFIAVHGNQDFILNAVSSLLGQYEDMTIRPRLMGGAPLVLTLAQTSWIFLASSVLAPCLFAIVGIFVWWRRRRQRK